MNCRDWEERIALYAGGDLPSDDAAKTEGHLENCASCRDFAAELRKHIAWTREAHQEMPAPADFAAMRAGVLERLERRQWPVAWGLLWAGGFAVIAVFLLLWHSPRSELARQAPPVAVANPPVPAVENPPPHVTRRLRRPHILRPKEAAEPLLVKLITDDPDVVIYWIVDPKGD